MKDIGDIVDSWVHSPNSHVYLLESWKKFIEVVEGSSKGLKGTPSKGSEDLTEISINFTFNLNY